MILTVGGLIEFLKTQPQDMPVAYQCYSEQCLLTTAEIVVKELCVARADGWIENFRKPRDKPMQDYLVFPGN